MSSADDLTFVPVATQPSQGYMPMGGKWFRPVVFKPRDEQLGGVAVRLGCGSSPPSP